ncbi:MAG: hypothetical protein LAT68_07320 [Cyclobacteriaceae bacterium]|nr:hypothetical protein [Cyclobacteriaceae bacterium]MCH8516125.1 hypothetical protein [Cyclobacteriaceae bacterium]
MFFHKNPFQHNHFSSYFQKIFGAFTICFLITAVSLVNAQEIPVGTWRTHLSYTEGMAVMAEYDEILYLSRDAIVRVSPDEGAVRRLSTVTGLSDVVPSAAMVLDQRTVVAYESGGIDILEGRKINTINTIRNAPQVGPRATRAMRANGNELWLANEQGLIEINLNSQQVNNAFLNLGEAATNLALVDLEVNGEWIVALAENELIYASRTADLNLADFSQWSREQAFSKWRSILSWQGDYYVATEDEWYIFNPENGNFDMLPKPFSAKINRIKHAGDDLFIATDSGLWDVGQSSWVVGSEGFKIADFYRRSSTEWWLAVSNIGLVQLQEGSVAVRTPNGLPQRIPRKVTSRFGETWAIFDREKQSVLRFQEGRWQEPEGLSSIGPVLDLHVDDLRVEALLAAPEKGLLKYHPEDGLSLHDAQSFGSTLLPRPDGSLDLDLITRLPNGDIYTYGSQSRRFAVLNTEGEWTARQLPTGVSAQLAQLNSDLSGNLWLRSPQEMGGLWAFQLAENRVQRLSTDGTQGGLGSNLVTDVHTDRRGQIWISHQQGINFFSSPFGAFQNPPTITSQPVVDNRLFLFGDRINTITSDAGNRKWIGTNNGLWVFLEGINRTFYHITTQNSPLPDNQILDLSIDGRNGEVFILTPSGLFSFREGTSEANRIHGNVRIFPTPAPVGQAIIIDGLAQDARIKITTLAGRKVFETRAFGGTARWSQQDAKGGQVTKGIYLVFSTSADNEDHFVGKIAVMD